MALGPRRIEALFTELKGQFSVIPATILTPTGTTVIVDWNNGNLATVDFQSATGNVTPTFNNPRAGAIYVLNTIQRATTPRQYASWPAAFLWPSGAPVISAVDDSENYLHWIYDGTHYHPLAGTRMATIADQKVDYTTGDLDTEAELITAFNTTNTALNSILAVLRAHNLINT